MVFSNKHLFSQNIASALLNILTKRQPSNQPETDPHSSMSSMQDSSYSIQLSETKHIGSMAHSSHNSKQQEIQWMSTGLEQGAPLPQGTQKRLKVPYPLTESSNKEKTSHYAANKGCRGDWDFWQARKNPQDQNLNHQKWSPKFWLSCCSKTLKVYHSHCHHSNSHSLDLHSHSPPLQSYIIINK